MKSIDKLRSERWRTFPAPLLLAVLVGIAGRAGADNEFSVNGEDAADAAEGLSVRFSLAEGAVITMPNFPRRRPLTADASQERMMAIYQDIEAENWSSAIRALRPVLREEPDNMGAHTAAVFVFDQMGRHREAAVLLEQMVERFPEDYRVLNNLAWIYATADEAELRDVNRAFDLVRDAILRAPGDYRVWSTLAECYYISGDFERAQETLAKVIDMATAANARPRDLREYRERLMRYRQANAVFRLHL